MSQWSKNEALATAPPIESWLSIDETMRSVFSNRQMDRLDEISNRVMAITMLVEGKTYREITESTGLARSTVIALFKKCLNVADDGHIFGFRALAPYTHIKPSVRRRPISVKRQEQRGGMSCALAGTLARFPLLEETLIGKLKKERGEKNPKDFHPRGTAMVRLFYSILRRYQVTDQEWPFSAKLKGKRTIEKYMKAVLQHSFEDGVEYRGDKTAKAHLATGTGHRPIIQCADPFDMVEIDAYHIDSFLTVAFNTTEGTTTDVTLSRLWLLAVVERLSSAILAYKIVYASEVSAADVASVIREAICKLWRPRILKISGLTYLPGGGFPSGVITEAGYAVWSVTMLDGALAHLAKLIHEEVRKSTGFVINWGPPGHFEHRPDVERMFRKIAQDIFHRLPSTTGSNPGSGRADEPEKTAAKFRIRVEDAEELVDVYFAEHNGVPGERNSFNSPLDALRFYLCGDSPRCMVRTLPLLATGKSRLVFRSIKKAVRGSVISGRRPYIQFENVRYTSPLLSNSAWLLNKTITIQVDDNDLRQVTAFLPNGQEFGILVAQGKWGVTRHDLKTRKAIFSLIYKRILILSATDDPVFCYLDYLANRSKTNKKHDHGFSPKDATEATRVSKNAGVEPRISRKDGAQKLNLSAQSVHERPASSVMSPLPDDFFKVKNR